MLHICVVYDQLMIFYLQHVSNDLYWYYLFELAFYWGLVLMLFKDSKRKVSAR